MYEASGPASSASYASTDADLAAAGAGADAMTGVVTAAALSGRWTWPADC